MAGLGDWECAQNRVGDRLNGFPVSEGFLGLKRAGKEDGVSWGLGLALAQRTLPPSGESCAAFKFRGGGRRGLALPLQLQLLEQLARECACAGREFQQEQAGEDSAAVHRLAAGRRGSGWRTPEQGASGDPEEVHPEGPGHEES